VEDRLYRVKGASQGLALLPCAGHGWAEEVRRESWSPVYGQKAPMTVLNFSRTASLPVEFATLLVTLKEAHPADRSFTRIATAGVKGQDPVNVVHEYKYAVDGLEHSFVFGARGESWRIGSLTSDAEFVYWKRKLASGSEQLNPEQPSDGHLMFCNGSFAEVSDGAALRCTRRVQWAELVVNQGVREVFSSDLAALEESSELLRQDSAAPVSE
jgi:hypothetical protein